VPMSSLFFKPSQTWRSSREVNPPLS
jgi:hypothetical protein